MAFVPVPDGIKVVMKFLIAGQQVCNVFYCTTTSTVDDTFLDTLGAAIKDWWVANCKPWQVTALSLQAIELTDASVAGGIGIEYTTGLPQPGANAGVALPNNVTLAVKLGTGHTGRSYRGRQYWLGLPEAYLDSTKNAVLSTYLTNVKGAYDLLISDIVSAGAELVIASLYSGVDSDGKPIPRTTAVTTPVGSVSVNPTVDSQRRRLPERGA